MNKIFYFLGVIALLMILILSLVDSFIGYIVVTMVSLSAMIFSILLYRSIEDFPVVEFDEDDYED